MTAPTRAALAERLEDVVVSAHSLLTPGEVATIREATALLADADRETLARALREWHASLNAAMERIQKALI